MASILTRAVIARTAGPQQAQQLDDQNRGFKDRVFKRGDGIVNQIREVMAGNK